MAGHSCANTGSPAGPFQMQTYEAADYRNVYARTMELAAYNQLFPEHASFALPLLEVGDRSAASGQFDWGYIPPVILKAIAWMESGWAQASYDPLVPYGEVGPTLVSHDCGYGIMQVTSGMQNLTGVPNLDQAMIGGHYAFNIARGSRILADKWNQAPEFRPLVGNRDRTIIENWYYALWSYNGFAFKNHPLNPIYDANRPPFSCGPADDGLGHNAGAYPYQELVLGCATHPPLRGGVQLWTPVDVTLPNRGDPAFAGPLAVANWEPCALNLNCAPMDMPIPPPYHWDPSAPNLAREQIFGAPNLHVTQGSLGFEAIPGRDSLGTIVGIVNAGTGIMSWRATPTASWIRLDRSQGVSLGTDLGSATQQISVQASANGLGPGVYTAEVVVESLFASGAPVRIPVTLTVSLKAGQSMPADFTGDGKTDLVFLCCTDYALLWISNGAGGFTTSTFSPWPGYGMTSGTWQPGDFNGDARMDMVHLCCEGYANVWLSNGNGTFSVSSFAPWEGYGVLTGAWQTGDFNGDGRTDLLHLTRLDYAHTWLSNGNGSFNVGFFRPWPDYGVLLGTSQVGDFNRDGRTDLVHLTPFDYVNTWLSNGDGGFSVTAFRPWPGYGMTAGSWQVGDFNGDGRTDLVHLTPFDYVNTWLSNGVGGFNVATFGPWPGYGMTLGSWQAGDFNGDGKTDLVHLTPFDYVHTWLSNGNGSFNVGTFRPWPGYDATLGSWQRGDYDGDGRTDLLHLCCHYAHIWRSQGNGSFAVSTFSP